MIQEKLWKKMLVCSILFSAAAMGVMCWFSATKTIVIAEEAAPEQGNASAEALNGMENPLSFTHAGGTGLIIPLPEELRADDIVIENRYMEHEIHIILTGKCGAFYDSELLLGDDARVKDGFWREEDGITRLRLRLTGLYEHQYMFENGMLRLSFQKPGALYDKILVLDAACGGDDSGDTGYGMTEKQLTLEIAELVRKKLADSQIRVYCTRVDDTGIPEEKRIEFADELQADMLLCIRVGADESNHQVFGIQTFYNGTYFIPYFGNVQLADLLERDTVAATGSKANGLFEAKKDDFLLQNAQMPAAAIEIGYLSNKEEAAYLKMPEYREKLAEGIANAAKDAFAAKELEH